MNSHVLSIVVFMAYLALSAAYSYHLGACPTAKPMLKFQMKEFLGNWYVIQKTSTKSKCIAYEYEQSSTPGHYRITHKTVPMMQFIGFSFIGTLRTGNTKKAAHMTAVFPISKKLAGSASHTVIDTDYKNYAAIFACQQFWNLTIFHRRSVMILSRDRTLDQTYVEKIHGKFSSLALDTSKVSDISQDDCHKTIHYFKIDDAAVKKFTRYAWKVIKWIGLLLL